MSKQITILLLMGSWLWLVSSKPRPNIVFILTDDQDVVLNGLSPMTKTKRLIADKGVTFENAFATTPICCPSRSSILTGLYLHSHNTVNNSLSGGCASSRWRHEHESKTFGAVLNKAGYRTFYAGKYLNKYGLKRSGGVEHVPPGWDWWVGLVGNSVYYNYTLSVNGSAVRRGDEETDYLTDVIKNYSLDFLNEGYVRNNPFLMVICPPAPHEPFTPANRHKGAFSGLKAPRTPSFNSPSNGTKHWLLRLPPDVLPPGTVDMVDEVFRNRWESLLSVDELVQDIITKLEVVGVLNKTYILFSSDHGFHLGQFGLPWDKRQPYETDIRIPLLMRGPGVSQSTVRDIVLNIDFAATILDMAAVPGGKRFGDGKSFLPAVNSLPNGSGNRRFLIEYRGEGSGDNVECYQDPNVKLCTFATSCKCFDARNNTFTCLRRSSEETDDIYCEFEDSENFEEYYDLKKDPNQMNNLATSVNTSVPKRILERCREIMRSKKAVDECLIDV